MISVAAESKRETDRESAPEPNATGPNANMRSPFMRLADLIGGIEPGKPIIDLGVGEPKHPIPDFVGPVMAKYVADFGRYPRNEGIPEFRAAVSSWAARRYQLGAARFALPRPDAIACRVVAGPRDEAGLGAEVRHGVKEPRDAKARSGAAKCHGCAKEQVAATRRRCAQLRVHDA